MSCWLRNRASLWGLKHGWAPLLHLSSCLAAADSYSLLPAASIQGLATSSFFPIGRPLCPTPDWALHSRRRVGALPLNPLRPNYRDCRRNGEEMQSYSALIEDAFNTFLRPLWPLYVSDEAESPPVGLKNIYLFVTKGKEHSDLWLRYLRGGGCDLGRRISSKTRIEEAR